MLEWDQCLADHDVRIRFPVTEYGSTDEQLASAIAVCGPIPQPPEKRPWPWSIGLEDAVNPIFKWPTNAVMSSVAGPRRDVFARGSGCWPC